jgi:hypothetical protein
MAMMVSERLRRGDGSRVFWDIMGLSIIAKPSERHALFSPLKAGSEAPTDSWKLL